MAMAYSEDVVEQVWGKARLIPDRDSSEWRQDECGAWLRRDAYHHDQSEFGWVIVNTSLGGADVVDNLRPLHCNNAFDRANGKAHCYVKADRTGLQPTGSVDHPKNKWD